MDWNDFPKKEIYWTITKDCNLCCADCYYSAYPGGETASLEHIKAMIEHFPRDMKVIHISGGEVLKTFDTLMYALNFLVDKYRIGLKVNDFSIYIQSNLTLLTEKMARGIADMGAGIIGASSDEFHRESFRKLHGGDLDELLKEKAEILERQRARCLRSQEAEKAGKRNHHRSTENTEERRKAKRPESQFSCLWDNIGL